MYVTPEKFKTMGFGVDLEGIEDFEMASVLDRASSVVDAYCSLTLHPQRGSFLGGSVTSEQHPWRLPEAEMDAGSRRIYPYNWPIISVTDFRVKVTNTQYVQIAPTELFINNAERYVEVISLAFTGVGLFGAIMPSIGLMKPVAEISYVYGSSDTVTNEYLYSTDGFTYRAANQFWTNDPVVVRVEGIEQTTGFVLDRTEGTVIFSSPLDPTETNLVSVDYRTRLRKEVRDGTGMIATYLLWQRNLSGKGMGGLQSLKLGEITITREKHLASDGSNLSDVIPSAADILSGLRAITVRG